MTAPDATPPGSACPHQGYDHGMRELEARVDGITHSWEIEGPIESGPDHVMLDQDDDLTAGTPWASDGYTIRPHLDADGAIALRNGIADLIARELTTVGVPVPEPFEPERYHELADDEIHRQFTARNNCFFLMEELPISRAALETCVGDAVGRPVVLLEAPGRPPSFVVRVVRPSSADHSPPHRDVWLPHLRNTIAAYLPVAGSHASSSLPLIAGSHRWAEVELERTHGNAIANGVQYGVPAVAGSARPLDLLRPDPAAGEIMIFSPYLVHGAGINLGTVTRISLELRFRQKVATEA